MKGIIVVNSYLRPKESIKQAQRLKEELLALNISAEIVSDLSNKIIVKGGKLSLLMEKIDFAIFLDKDKYLSYSLEKLGVKVFNSHDSIRICDDKLDTYLYLAGKGVKLIDTLLGRLSYSEEDLITNDYVDFVVEKLSLPVVVKEGYGSMGKGVHLAKTREELLMLLEKVKCRPHSMQKYLSYKSGQDIRVIVIGKKVVASMIRKNPTDFRSNIGAGGSGVMCSLTKIQEDTAIKVASLLGLDYAGIDLLDDTDGIPYVCEVNSNAFFEGIEKVTGINVAKAYAEHIISKL